MRLITACNVLAFVALAGACGAALGDPPAGYQAPSTHRALFITPMGEPFRAANPGQRGIEVWFATADTDHDGKISRAEFIAEAMNFFVVLDTNKDGAATSAESTALWRARAPEVLGLLDLSPPIMSQAPDQDASHHHGDDGDSGSDYMVEGSDSRAQGGVHHDIPVDNRTGPARYGILNDAEPVLSCDTNFDRRVTREEFAACADRRFTQLDLNHDGFLTLEEADAAARAQAQR